MPTAIAKKILGVDFTATGPVKQHELGIILSGVDGRRYQYIKAGAAIGANYAVIVDTANGVHARKQSTGVNQPIAGVAHVAIANGEYGWVVVGGIVSVRMAAGTAAGAVLGTSATSGVLAALTVSSTPTQGEVQAIAAAAAGIGATCVVAESGGIGSARLA